jgi:tetratricopeptide (TPR) repeat protein
MKALKSLRRGVVLITLVCVVSILLGIACTNKKNRVTNARQFIREWNYDRALTEIISFREDKDPEVQYLLGYCYLRKNEFDEAAHYFENSLETSDMFKDSILNLYSILAQNAVKIDEPMRALFFYQEMAKLVPEYEQASNLFLIGDINFEQGKFSLAAEAYMRALEIDSTSSQAKEARPKLIRALMESNKLDRALHLAEIEYEKLKTAANLLQLSEVRFMLGKKLFEAELLDSAMMYFGEIVASQEPKSLLDDAYFYLGEIYAKKNMLQSALESYQKVLRLNPYETGDIIKQTKKRIREIKERL